MQEGFIDIALLNGYLSTLLFFTKGSVKMIEKIGRWEFLEEEVFEQLYKDVFESLKNEKVQEMHCVITFSEMLLLWNSEKLIDYDKKDIIALAEKNISRLLEDGDLDSHNISSFYCSFQVGKVLNQKEGDIRRVLLKKIEEKSNLYSGSFLKLLFEEINNSNVRNLEERLEKLTINSFTSFYNTNIFKEIDSEKFGKRTLDMKGEAINELKWFFCRRYEEIQPYHSEECCCLNGFVRYLEDNNENIKPLKKRIILTLIKKVNEFLEKIPPPEINFG